MQRRRDDGLTCYSVVRTVKFTRPISPRKESVRAHPNHLLYTSCIQHHMWRPLLSIEASYSIPVPRWLDALRPSEVYDRWRTSCYSRIKRWASVSKIRMKKKFKWLKKSENSQHWLSHQRFARTRFSSAVSKLWHEKERRRFFSSCWHKTPYWAASYSYLSH